MSAQLTIEFIAPNKLNELKEGECVQKTIWSYAGVENSILVLDTNNWTISCEANNICESIANWVVDEMSCVMKIKSDTNEEAYKELDYPFAVSMIGQMCDVKDLISYLQSLQEVFNIGRKHDTPLDSQSEKQ